MTWTEFIYRFTTGITIAADVIVICHVFPAFRQTKKVAFLLIAIACVLGIIDTACDFWFIHNHNIDNSSAYAVYYTARKITFIIDIVLSSTGVVLLARIFLNGTKSASSESEQRTKE
jgi:hypothetical protein